MVDPPPCRRQSGRAIKKVTDAVDDEHSPIFRRGYMSTGSPTARIPYRDEIGTVQQPDSVAAGAAGS